ncbi:MAG TPA: hypothetical protein PLL23_03595 [Chitinophagaceae bacterium]|nr:hypothetical protein [Chitinophagaceae bacterium]
MKKTSLIFLSLIVLSSSIEAQVTPVVSPAANIPKLVIPATFAGKLKLADSLQKLKTPTGVMLKTFLPQYSPQFQDQLSENLVIIAKTQWSADYKVSYKETIRQLFTVVRAEYPQITRPNMYRIFYKMSYSIFDLRLDWAWQLDEELSTLYGDQRHYLILTGPKYLKESKMDLSETFSYYLGPADVYFFVHILAVPLSDDTLRKYSPQTIVSSMLRAGHTPELIYDYMKKNGCRVGIWLIGFCKANAEVSTPVETVARILKKDYFTNEELVYLLSNTPGYNSPASLLKAQQAN